MASYEKVFERWEHTRQPETWETVESILIAYGFKLDFSAGKGTHLTYTNPALKAILKKVPKNSWVTKLYGPNGQIVVVRHGKKVYRPDLKNIIETIKIIEEDARLGGGIN